MFSSLAAYLPVLNAPNAQPVPHDESPQEEEKPTQPPPPRPPRKSRELKMPNETLVIVRPPPSKTNHPLNLQVQLVPPHSKPPSGVADPVATTPTSASSTGSAATDGASLARTSSSRSQASSYNNSAYGSSTTSFASVASTASSSSTTGARRTIIPLYNLQAHNVMPNVIVDAGTDARIAKFHKRGIDLIDLATFEPVEVWGDKDVGSRDARKESNRISIDELGAILSPSTQKENSNWGGLLSGRSIGGFLQPTAGAGSPLNPAGPSNGGGSSSRPVTPSAASSAASLQYHHHALQHQQTPERKRNSLLAFSTNSKQSLVDSIHSKPAPAQPGTPASPAFPSSSSNPTPQQPKRNIFGKLFNKRNSVQPEHDTSDPSPTFTLSPAPPPKNAVFVKDFDPRPRHSTSTSPNLTGSPLSLVTTDAPSPHLLSPTSPSPQDRTPTNANMPGRDDSPISPTPTIAPSPGLSIKGPLKLTNAITAPLKQTLKNNRNRFSAVLGGGGNSNNSHTTPTPQPQPPVIGSSRGSLSLAAAAEELNRSDALTTTSTTHSSSDLNHNDRDQGSGSGSGSAEGDMTLTQSSAGAGPGGLPPGSTPTSARVSQQQQQGPGQRGSLVAGGDREGEAYPAQGQAPSIIPPPQPQPQTQLDIITLSKTQQLALRPPVLGIQPTFVSASSNPNPNNNNPSNANSNVNSNANLPGVGANGSANNLGVMASPRPSMSSAGGGDVLGPAVGESPYGVSGSAQSSNQLSKEKEKEKDNPLAGQRALMYVWLVKKWMKKVPKHVGNASGGGGGGSGFLGMLGGGGHERNAGGGSVGGGSVNGDVFSDGNGSGFANGAGGSSGSGLGGGAGKREREGSNAFSNFGDAAVGFFNNPFGKEKEKERESKRSARGGRKSRDDDASSLRPPASAATLHGGFDDPFVSHHQQDSSFGPGQGYATSPVSYGNVEVRFEWKRARGKGDKDKDRERDGRSKARKKRRSSASRADSVSQLGGGSDGEAEREREYREREREKERKKNYRMSTGSHYSTATNASNDSLGILDRDRERSAGGTASSKRSARTMGSSTGLGLGRGGEDPGEESDPEDSETPWVCTLKVRRVVISSSHTSTTTHPPPAYANLLSPTALAGHSPLQPLPPQQPQIQQQVLKLKVGTLSPTPHHPKVVAMLKVPFPLPDVEVERMTLIKRKRMGQGGTIVGGEEQAEDEEAEDEKEKEPYHGLVLTAEEIKDVICSTGLWLVVREGFGGVGKVNRKGDGWRIRA